MKNIVTVLMLLIATTAFGQLEVRTIDNPSVVINAADTAQVNVTASDVKRNPVAVRQIDDSNVWEIIGDGEIWVRVTAIDFDKKTYNEKEVKVTADDSDFDPPPDDEDKDDTDPPDPPEPSEYDGPNKYGLGKLAFNKAPSHNVDVVKHYNAAAEFLYGRPSMKVMYVEQDDPRRDTDFVVTNWIRNQMTPIVQQDERWRVWYDDIMNTLFRLNREDKIRRTEDWYTAWREIAAGVEARKKGE